ncbi:probable mitochondrial import inner membrane translocase subunit TIM21 isoform X1 [Alnus glutinosa]|uniref:probable mitochondrial import inner membrane translocase subunit TIM21 isoform X1 n=1 Tax=Alnus glutinosa TaxID=3517 RepID=UPI002D766E5F|nr:probable mitochondrial import inner membrane translocase subunit TIM21 isoform X1 [Alnus glutinosa]
MVMLVVYKYMLGLWRNKQLDVVRFLSEMRRWNCTQSRSIFYTMQPFQTSEACGLGHEASQLLVLLKSSCGKHSTFHANHLTKGVRVTEGIPVLFRGLSSRDCTSHLPFQLKETYGPNTTIPFFTRSISSKASEQPGQTGSKKQPGRSGSETKKDISTVEDPFDAPTYNIPEKPVTFVEGASYTAIILAGLGIAGAAGYAVFKELIFQPKEYKVFNKALKRIQDDSQVRVRIGSPITGYGQESRNRAARQRIPNKIWTDEDGVEHVEINFYIRGPHGAGKVYSEMFKDPVDKQWKYTYLIVEIKSPTPSQLILESYMPAYNVDNK